MKIPKDASCGNCGHGVPFAPKKKGALMCALRTTATPKDSLCGEWKEKDKAE